jgi:hypothetical protein
VEAGRVRDKRKRNYDGMRMSSAKRSLSLPNPTFHELSETNQDLITRDLSQKKHIYILKIRKYAGPNRPSGTRNRQRRNRNSSIGDLHPGTKPQHAGKDQPRTPTPTPEKTLNVNAKPLRKLHA